MMKKTKTFIAVLLLLVAGQAWGQALSEARNPVEGYIITLAGDTIRGTVDYLSGAENAVACHFCPEGGSEFRLYSPGDIRGYRFLNDGVYYVSRTFDIGGKAVNVFAEFLLQGGVSLYRYEGGEHVRYFLVDNEGKTATIDGRDIEGYRAEEQMRMKRENLREASQILYKSEAATTSLWRKKVTAENLVDVTRRYNEEFCAEDGDCVVFQYDAQRSKLYTVALSFWAGTGRCYINSNYRYNTLMHRIGIGLESTSARLNPNLSLQAVLTAGVYNDRDFFSESFSGQDRLWLQLDCGALYRFSSKARSTGFVRGGLSLALAMGGYVGAGWEFRLGKHRLQTSLNGYYQGIITSGSLAKVGIDVGFCL